MTEKKKINAGKVLLKELCDYFNLISGYPRIDNIFEIHKDDKDALLIFINNKTGKTNISERALDRFIKDAKDCKNVGKIPSSNPVLCTICYVVLTKSNPKLPFLKQVITRKVGKGTEDFIYGCEIFALQFTKYYIEPLAAGKALTQLPVGLSNSCWYVYINVVDREAQQRKTGRRILRLQTNSEETTNCEYFVTENDSPGWIGFAEFDPFKNQIHIQLKTECNVHRTMKIVIHLSHNENELLEGDIAYTVMKEPNQEYQTQILIEKVDCSSDLTVGEGDMIKGSFSSEIDERLKTYKRKIQTIVTANHKIPCGDSP